MSTTVFNRNSLLLIEDDPNDILLFRRAFAKINLNAGLHVIEDGEQALQYLMGSPPWNDRKNFPLPSLVVLDLKLPRLPGLDVLAWIRGQERLRRLPVVILTSSRENHDVNRAYELGANSYLVKPAGFEPLVEMLRDVWNYWFLLNEGPEVGDPALPTARKNALTP